jgi:hypothetical protein
LAATSTWWRCSQGEPVGVDVVGGGGSGWPAIKVRVVWSAGIRVRLGVGVGADSPVDGAGWRRAARLPFGCGRLGS